MLKKMKQKGQGMVEFALILPPLLMLILGIIEAARVFHAYLAVQHAAREAARYAITGRPFDEFDPNDGPFEHPDAERAAAIKQVAVDQALGLPIDYWGLTPADFDANINKPAFFGVDIHGFDSYDQPEKRDDPGQPGLPVRVRVVYNLVVLDPLYRAIIPQIRLVGHAEMVNEGIQVGHGGAPPPTWGPTPTFPVPPTPTDTPTPTGPYIVLDSYSVLPNQGITIELMQHLPSGSYDVYWIAPGGAETLIGTRTTNGSGYATLPWTVPGDSVGGTYTIESRRGGSFVASVNLEVQGPTPTATDTATPTETATPTITPTPTSTPTGAYIALDQYSALAGVTTLTVYLIQHEAFTTYEVYWKPEGSPDTDKTLIDTCQTDDTGRCWLLFDVPAGTSPGTYTIQSWLSGAKVAQVNFDVLEATPTPTVYAPPDLVVTNISVGAPPAISGTPITVTVQIQNNGGTTAELFDIDLYVDPEFEPLPLRAGIRKQWQNGLAAGATATLIFDVTLYSQQAQLWAQVDTTNFVDDEANEDNNISGPVNVTTTYCPLYDDMESGPDGWAPHEEYEWTP